VGPSAPQNTAAQLHNQPTPSSVAAAERGVGDISHELREQLGVEWREPTRPTRSVIRPAANEHLLRCKAPWRNNTIQGYRGFVTKEGMGISDITDAEVPAFLRAGFVAEGTDLERLHTAFPQPTPCGGDRQTPAVNSQRTSDATKHGFLAVGR
jgi:hypothetical protein